MLESRAAHARRIRNWANRFLLGAVGALAVLVAAFFNPASSMYVFGATPGPKWMLYFVLALAVFYLITGVAVLRRAWVGYWLLMVHFTLFLLVIPFGTIAAWRTLRYLRQEEVRTHFLEGQGL